MCSLRLIKHSLKRSACCFFRCTSYFWGLECFRRWLVLRVGSLAELQHAGVYVESTELGGDGGRHELVILQRPASGFDQLGKSFKQIEAPLNVTFGDNLMGNKTRSGASFLDIENLISPSLFWYFVLSVWIASNLWLDTDSQPQSCQWTNPRHRSRIRCRSSPECGPSSSWVCRPARETTHNIVVLFVHDNV